MAVTNESARTPTYTLDGVNNDFTFDFPVEDSGDITVFVKTTVGAREQTQLTGSDFSVTATNNDWSQGGTVTLSAGALAEHNSGTMVIIRKSDQATALTGSELSAAAIIDEVDDLQRQIHELQEKIDRALVHEETDSAGVTLPENETRASRFFGWDAEGDPIAAFPADMDESIVVTPFAEEILDDASAGAVRTTIDALGTTEQAADSDTVDGEHASAFADAVHNHDADYADIDHTDHGNLMIVEDVKTYSTNGGTATAGTNQTRDLNTVRLNEITGASLATNQITLPAGTYNIGWSCPFYFTGSSWSWVYDTTGAATLVSGSNGYSQAATSPSRPDATFTFGFGRFVLSVESVIEVRTRVTRSQASNGLGVRGNTVGFDNVYTRVKIEKVA